MSDYDVIYLAPKTISSIRSRKDVDLKSGLFDLYPLISSPMKGISGVNLVVEMGKNNCLGILHRFDNMETRKNNVDKISSSGVKYGVAIGVNNWDQELDFAEYSVEHKCDVVCLDISNGYIPQVKEMGQKLRNRLGDKIKLMTGNVINEVGAQYAKDSGFDLVRCSIGSGNVCTTRLETGIGRNALVVLDDCFNVDIGLVIDGGIKNPGDVVKSFAVGADFAMLGSVLAYANEAEDPNGKIWGMASLKNHIENGKEIKSIEGREIQLDLSKKVPLKEILDRFTWGIRSACTYLNCSSYKDLPYNSEIVSVNENF